jgi:sodium/hydrogen antiporter
VHHPFETVLLCLGALLIVGALISGITRKSFLSLTAVFVLAGAVLGDAGLGVLHFDEHSVFVEYLAVIALIIILFRDGLEVDGLMLRQDWHMPVRKLLIAMPVTAMLVAGAAVLIFDFSWTSGLLIGALLAPTDPILTSAIITNEKVPARVRHSLNLESGLNDGLALPAVLAFTAALVPALGDDFVWWKFVIQDVGLGVTYGVVFGLFFSFLTPVGEDKMPRHQKSLFAFGVAFLTYGVATLGPHGNGLIAVFVCAITLGLRRADIQHAVEDQSTDIAELIKLAVFVVFGALLTLNELFHMGVLAVLAFIAVVFVIARPLAILLALTGSKQVDLQTKLFMGWFGPKGIATMAFSLLVLASGAPGSHEIFAITSAVVFASILLHGSTDHAGAKWAQRHTEKSTAS